MFDIGFFELLLISVVGLLVFGPEQFLDAVRTTSVWLKRIRRSFDEVKSEVQRELHNDEVMRNLREDARQVEQQVQAAVEPLAAPVKDLESTVREGMAHAEGLAEPAKTFSPATQTTGIDGPAQADEPAAKADGTLQDVESSVQESLARAEAALAANTQTGESQTPAGDNGLAGTAIHDDQQVVEDDASTGNETSDDQKVKSASHE